MLHVYSTISHVPMPMKIRKNKNISLRVEDMSHVHFGLSFQYLLDFAFAWLLGQTHTQPHA